jgi:SAM-dependent methyltransferase
VSVPAPSSTRDTAGEIGGASAREAPTCLCCGARRWSGTLLAEERQFGLPGRFTYAQCGACDALQLLDAPADLGAYYPPGYYSFDAGPGSGLADHLKRARALAAVTGRGTVGRLLGFVQPAPEAGLHRWLARAGITRDSRILDVGCGGGGLLRTLARAGYRHLTGVDPFLAADATDGPVRLLRRTVEQIDETFDLVMMHHALEHVPRPAETVRALRARCGADGTCLIRVPIVPSAAFRRYGPHWVQLDAPRHLVIPSARGLLGLADAAGFTLVAQRHDSTAIQWWGERALCRWRAAREGRRAGRLARSAARRLRAWRANRRGDGDQAAFLFRVG